MVNNSFMQGQTNNMLSISLTHFPDASNLHFINNLRTGNSLFILKESTMNYQRLYDMLCEKAYNRFSDFYVRSSNLRIVKSIIYKETDDIPSNFQKGMLKCKK